MWALLGSSALRLKPSPSAFSEVSAFACSFCESWLSACSFFAVEPSFAWSYVVSMDYSFGRFKDEW